MSASQENLPAVAEKPPTLPGVLWTLAGLIFKREALLGLSIVGALVVLGGTGVVWAQDKFLGPVEKRQDEQDKRMANVERMTVETNATVKIIAYRLGVTPLSLEQKDGGQ